MAPNWAIGGSLKWTRGEFSQVKIDNITSDGFKWDATTARFDLGFPWYPMSSR